MISILIILTQILIALACAGGMLALYVAGAREGAKLAALLEIYDRFPDLRPQRPLSEEEQALRDSYLAAAKERIYQLWRRTYNLPNNAMTQELFADDNYRKGLEEQANHA